MATLQFVDSIASSPTLRLDINDGTNFNLFRDPDFSPPPLKRVRTATLMTDGDYIAATAYANRVIRLKLRAHGTSKDNLATNLQNLDRELDRKNNILKWQSTNATNPVFFRTFRSPDYKLEVGLNQSGDALNDVVVTLTIEAEPFAYGLRVTGSPITVNNDPAAGSNGLFLNVVSVMGDVPTPVVIQLDPASASDADNLWTVIGTRARDFTAGPSFIQAEGCTQGTDTSVQVTDAVMSGAANNYSRTTFATATMQTRLTWAAFPTSKSVDARGDYRIFARVRKGTAGDGINIRMNAVGINWPSVATPSTTNRVWLDLGIITHPIGVDDPIVDGYSNTPLQVRPVSLAFQAERTSGAGTLDWDAFIAIPADQQLSITKYVCPATFSLWLDGATDTAVIRDNTSDGLVSDLSVLTSRVGQFPMLSPNRSNLLVILLNTNSALNDDKTWTSSVTVSYWPRWLYIRP